MKPRVKHKAALNTLEAKAKKRKRMVVIGSIVMMALMVFSVAEFLVNSGGSGTTLQTSYGDYKFTLKDLSGSYGKGASAWVTTLNGQEVQFQYLPVQVTDMQIDPQALAILKNSVQLALSASTNMTTSDAGDVDYARLQLGLAIPKAFNAMNAQDDRYSLPVFNCSMATPQLPVLYFNISNESSIATNGNCIILNGEQRDLMRLTDRLIFEYYGIMSDVHG